MSNEDIRKIIADNIIYHRERNGLNKKNVAEFLGVSPSSVTHWEDGSNSIDINKLSRLCTLFKCELSDMVKKRDSSLISNGKNNFRQDINEREISLVGKYRRLTERNQEFVDILIDKTLEFQQPETYEPIKLYHPCVYYDFPVSAGTGEYPEIRNAIAVKLEIKPPHGTNYILRIAGDSMEPKFRNGDFVYVHSTSSVDIGDIGIFAYCGSVYMKKYTKDGLKSLNPKYPLIYGEDIKTLGKVLGVVDGEII